MNPDLVSYLAKAALGAGSLAVLVWLAYIGKFDPTALGQLALVTLGGVVGHSAAGGGK